MAFLRFLQYCTKQERSQVKSSQVKSSLYINKSAISEGDLAVQLAVLLDTWAATQAPFGADRVLRARCERDENSESWTVVDVENARGHSWLEWIAWH